MTIYNGDCRGDENPVSQVNDSRINITDIRVQKAALEREIYEAIVRFQYNTGLFVDEVRLVVPGQAIRHVVLKVVVV